MQKALREQPCAPSPHPPVPEDSFLSCGRAWPLREQKEDGERCPEGRASSVPHGGWREPRHLAQLRPQDTCGLFGQTGVPPWVMEPCFSESCLDASPATPATLPLCRTWSWAQGHCRQREPESEQTVPLARGHARPRAHMPGQRGAQPASGPETSRVSWSLEAQGLRTRGQVLPAVWGSCRGSPSKGGHPPPPPVTRAGGRGDGDGAHGALNKGPGPGT